MCKVYAEDVTVVRVCSQKLLQYSEIYLVNFYEITNCRWKQNVFRKIKKLKRLSFLKFSSTHFINF